jgi:hypothetical protein
VRFLSVLVNASYDKELVFQDGSRAKNIVELIGKIETLNLHDFSHFVNHSKNDFANWIEYVIMDKDLSVSLRKTHSKEKTLELLKIKISSLYEKDEKHHSLVIGGSIIHSHTSPHLSNQSHNHSPSHSFSHSSTHVKHETVHEDKHEAKHETNKNHTNSREHKHVHEHKHNEEHKHHEYKNHEEHKHTHEDKKNHEDKNTNDNNKRFGEFKQESTNVNFSPLKKLEETSYKISSESQKLASVESKILSTNESKNESKEKFWKNWFKSSKNKSEKISSEIKSENKSVKTETNNTKQNLNETNVNLIKNTEHLEQNLPKELINNDRENTMWALLYIGLITMIVLLLVYRLFF